MNTSQAASIGIAPAWGAYFDSQATSSSGQPSVPQQAAPASQAESTATATAGASAQTDAQKSQEEKAAEQVKKEEQQRIAYVVPNFNVAYDRNAPPISARQKFSLAFHTVKDPASFAIAAVNAAYSQATDDFGPEYDTVTNSAGVKVQVRHEGYGQGWAGYGKRVGAQYADNFDGTLIGNAILPVLFKEDPRYFRMGTGSYTKRALYAISTTFWCKRDDGKWGPNYANVLGNFIAGGISNIYYPSNDRGAGLTFSRGLTVTLDGTLGGLTDEFLPDLARIFHRDVSGRRVPTNH